MNKARRFLNRSARRSRGRGGATPRRASRLLSLLAALFLITGLLSPFATLTASAQDATPEPTAVQDADGDGVEDALDVCSLGDDAIDTDVDGTPDACDDTPTGDTDGDGVDNATDATPNGDDDGDGVDNAVDACPAGDDAADADGDGTADACDDTPNGPAPVETAAPTEPVQPEPTAVLPTTAPPTEEPTDPAPEPTEETSSVTVEVAEEPQVVASAPVTCAVADAANPWIASDLDDYPPGALVTLTGGGWVAGQKVDILVDDDGVADAEMGPWSHSAVVTADAGGNLTYQFNLPDWFVANYTVTATGECSTASTTFTDARVVTSATLTGGSPITVAPGTSLSATVNVTTDGSGANARWRGTGWLIATAPGTRTCINTDNHDSPGGYSETISFTAPLSAGTYNAYFTAYNDDGCTGGVSNIFTLSNAVIVKLNQTITFPAITNKTFGDADIAPGATASSNLAVTYATSGQCSLVAGKIHIDGAGSCTVTASQAGNGTYFPAPDVSQSFTINKASATLSLGNLSQTYTGNPLPVTVTTLPANLTGVSVTYAGSTTAPTNAGSYAVVASLDNPNYTATNATDTLVIAKASQTITFAALADKTVGDADFDPGATASSGLSVTYTASGACTIVSGKVHLAGAGSCDVTAAQAGNDNVNAAANVTRSFSIAKATATITLSDPAPTYDGTAKTASVTTSPAGLTVQLVYSQNGETVAAPTNAGSYDVTATIDDASYTGSATGTLTIAPRAITVTADAKSKTYGEIDPVRTNHVTTGSLVGGDTFSGALSRDPGESAGEYDIIQGTLSLNANYDLTFVGATFTIDKKAASVTPNAAGKTFGANDPDLTGTLTGFLETDNVTATYSRVAGESVGAYAISATLAPESGLANYDITYNTALFTIAAKAVTVTPTEGQDKVFGADEPALTYALSEEVEVTGALSREPGDNAGTYAITLGTLKAASDNYTLVLADDPATFAITPASQTITFTSTAPEGATVFGTYEPEATASSGLAVTFGASGACEIEDDVVTMTAVGTCTVTANQVGNGNYSAAPQATQEFAVGKASATVQLVEASLSQTYDGNPKAASTTTTPDDLTVEFTYRQDGTEVDPVNAGAYDVTATINDDVYEGSVTGTLTIAKAEVTLTLVDADLSQTFDGTAKTVGVTTDPEGLLGVSVTFEDADGNAVAGPADAGEYVVTATLNNPNYTAEAVTGTLVIARASQTIDFAGLEDTTFGADPFAVTATASSDLDVTFAAAGNCTIDGGDVTITGAGACTITASQSGSTNYLAAEPVTQTFAISKATATLSLVNLTHVFDGTAKAATVTTSPEALEGVVITYDGSTELPVNAGSYAVVATLNNPNYQATAVKGTLVIDARAVTVSADAKTKIYGNADPALTHAVTDGSVIEGDAFTGNLSRAVGENVGPYAIGQGTLTLGDNYAIDFKGADLSITARAIEVTADAASKTYGNADPALTLRITSGSLVGTDAFTGALTRAAGQDVGTYAIGQGTLAINDNYTLAFHGADLVITKASQTITFGAPGGKTYGDAPFQVSATASSGLPVSFAAAGVCTISGTTVTITGSGSCTVTASQAGNGNYSAAPNVARMFAIAQASLTIKGFYQPLDLGGVVNTSKAGSTIPVKFEVFGPDGKEIKDTSRISIVAQKISCSSGAAEDVIELTATGGTSFRFDATGDQFIYNWQTPKSVGSCYQLTVVPTSTNEAIPSAPAAIVRLK